ncbi:MAG TPA: hypothetical protein VIH52_02395 [Candidatus Nanoarchaeia archaeon]
MLSILNLRKFKVRYLIFVVLLVLAFLVRWQRFDYPLAIDGGEGSRDYLVANHILVYQEFPLIGPWNAASDGSLQNSPVYFYLLSLFLVIKDSVILLGIVNILLQLLSITLIFLIALYAFGFGTALLAALIFSFGPEALRQSNYVWQPYVMQPLALLSLLLLLIFYTKKNYTYLVAGILTLTFANALHNSAFSLVPLYLIIAFFALKQQGKGTKYYLFTLGAFVSSLLVFYLPVIYSGLSQAGNGGLETTQDFLIGSTTEFIPHLTNVWTNLIHFFSLDVNNYTPGLNKYVTAVILICLAFYFCVLKNLKLEKKYTLVTVLFLAQTILLSTVLRSTQVIFYLTPIYGLFAILIGELVYRIFSQKKYLWIPGIVLIFLLLRAVTLNFQTLSPIFNPKTPLLDISQRDNSQAIKASVNKVKTSVNKIQKDRGYQKLDFFQIQSYRTGSYPVSSAVLWAPLEKELGSKFVKVSNNTDSLEQTNSNDYAFLACFGVENQIYGSQDCLNRFSLQNPGYSVSEKIYSNPQLSIYLTKLDKKIDWMNLNGSP